ncbi:MAG: hypothetical protein JXX14_23415 [Deltaproteobacteria bacterium]|nr:hypothetical protein [Deltaproteobacteria bacterium]
MAKAKDKIEFAIFTFSKSSGIDDQMALALRSGLTVRGALDARQGVQPWAPYKTLKKLGADLHLTQTHEALGKLHHKLLIIDRKVVITGSMNFTSPATTLNDENIVVIGKHNAKGEDLKAQKAFAQYAAKEVDRIITTFCQ